MGKWRHFDALYGVKPAAATEEEGGEKGVNLDRTMPSGPWDEKRNGGDNWDATGHGSGSGSGSGSEAPDGANQRGEIAVKDLRKASKDKEHIVGLEMEGWGLYRAATDMKGKDNHISVMVKGVVDYGDLYKGDAW